MSTEVILSAAADTCICKYYNNCNFGHSQELFIGNFSTNCCLYRSLLKFDLSSLSKNILISKAILKLFLYKKDYCGTQKITAYPLKNSFNEDSVNWNTELKTHPISASAYILDNQINTYIEIDITTFMFSWYKNIFPNYGIELLGAENTPSLTRFRSREYFNFSQSPQLVITYDNISSHIINLPSVRASEIGTPSFFVNTNFHSGITFYITNNDEYFIVAQLQVSNDGLIWYNEGSSIIIDGKYGACITSHAITERVRVVLKGVGICEAASVYATV
ncbi:DNRLRE domain-containing protein [Clostridium sp. CF012]|uniref:DNRLRE domain-containing protein n=1 Tax=Clostridium sp. CF012 TaxID=2843319 RepID=UPI001C0C70BE|nr:DNRLRE domain-containing protein [Clostridium sp. CF012]MBU3143973.1 DNRLRE domain-containing protein [Clostridium sp. CF012]